MAFVSVITDDQASGKAAEFFESDRASLGFVANYSRVLANRPAMFEGWGRLIGGIKSTMDPRRYELVTLAAATRLRSSYCALAHGKVLLDNYYGASDLTKIALDRGSGQLDEADVAVMNLAEKIVDDAGSVTQAEMDRLRELGLTDPEIIDVVVTTAARCFFSKTLDALGVQADSTYADMDPELRDALTVGRPIAMPA